MSQMSRKCGVIRKWNASRGFGFVRVTNQDGSFDSYFLHIRDIKSGEPIPGSGVVFNIGKFVKGAPPAIDAVIGPVIPKFAHLAEAVLGGVR